MTTITQPSPEANALQQAAAVAAVAEIRRVRMSNASFECASLKRSSGSRAKSTFQLDVTQEFGVIGATVHASTEFVLSLPPPKGSKELGPARVTGRFEIDYEIGHGKESPRLTDDAVSAFARINSIYNAWPFWREFVDSAVGRMGLPRLTLPLLTAPLAADLAGFGEKPGKRPASSAGRRRTK